MTISTPVALLLLADGRFPAGGYAHSHGMEEAVAGQQVTDLVTALDYARGALMTAGLINGALAAVSCACAQMAPIKGVWELLDAETDARMPSPAQRRVSRQLGRHLWRTACRIVTPPPSEVMSALEGLRGGPHNCIALGALVAGSGGLPADAARIGAYNLIMSVLQAAVRLLGLDPVAATSAVAALGEELEDVARRSGELARWATGTGEPAGSTGEEDQGPRSLGGSSPWSAAIDLDDAPGAPGATLGDIAEIVIQFPACSAPLLDYYAEAHDGRVSAMFAS